MFRLAESLPHTAIPGATVETAGAVLEVGIAALAEVPLTWMASDRLDDIVEVAVSDAAESFVTFGQLDGSDTAAAVGTVGSHPGLEVVAVAAQPSGNSAEHRESQVEPRVVAFDTEPVAGAVAVAELGLHRFPGAQCFAEVVVVVDVVVAQVASTSTECLAAVAVRAKLAAQGASELMWGSG